MWNLLCQYNNIYAGSYKYLKEKNVPKKKNCATWTNQSGIVATVQNLGKKNGSLHRKGHYRGIASFYIVSRKKSTNQWLKKKIHIVYIEQIKSTIVFTHSPNKCHNIITKYLFSVLVGHSFIFYYFVLTYKKLTP